MRVERIVGVIERKRETHPELSRELTWPGFLRICERERIAVRRAPVEMPRPAQLVPYRGRWAILLSPGVPRRRHLYLGAHELGHLWLHHDERHERTERVYNMDTHWPNDPREDDAELFASLILAGPARSRAMLPSRETHLQFAMRTTRRFPRGPR